MVEDRISQEKNILGKSYQVKEDKQNIIAHERRSTILYQVDISLNISYLTSLPALDYLPSTDMPSLRDFAAHTIDIAQMVTQNLMVGFNCCLRRQRQVRPRGQNIGEN